MIQVDVTHEQLKTRVIEEAADKAAFRNFAHAAAGIRSTAASLLRTRRPGLASPPGSPPYTHKGAFLRRSLRFHADKMGAVIGPRESVVGDVGTAHEFGGTYRGATYPERPFMEPALELNLRRFADSWQGSIGE